MEYFLKRKSGFTLLEVLISVILLSIGMVAMANLQVLGLRGNVDGEDRGNAAALASAQLNEFISMQYEQNPETGELNVDGRLAATTGYTTPRAVNKNGLSRPDLIADFGASDEQLFHEQFRYKLSWLIEDVGVQTLPGASKRISIRVTWQDRSVQVFGEVGTVSISQFRIAAKYM